MRAQERVVFDESQILLLPGLGANFIAEVGANTGTISCASDL